MTDDARIEVWQASTDVSAGALRGLLETLAPDERPRAESAAPGARRWAAGRSALRVILGGYLGRDPAAIRFAPGPHGKPAVAGGPQFSFSASGELALVAVSAAGPVGVDVERVRARRAVESVARSRFAPAERAALGTHDGAEREAAFHRCWAAKEAYAKGLGRGLTLGLDRFSVAGLLGREGARRCAVAHPGRAGGRWEVERLPAGEGYAAAIAAPGSRWRCARHVHRGPGGHG
jgi:4'-phosphopantetheinyl transferase